MSEPGDRSLREWIRLVDRALCRPSPVRTGPLDSPDLRMAFLAVPPEAFFPVAHTPLLEPGDAAVFDGEVADAMEAVALMLDGLEVARTQRILEIGTGRAYATAVLAGLAAEVHTLERSPSVAARARERLARLDLRNVTVHEGDGSVGLPQFAPFDGILVSSSGARVGAAVKGQLRVGGRMVLLSGLHRLRQSLVRITRTGSDTFEEERLGARTSRPRLGDLLVQEGRVRREPLEAAATRARTAGCRLGEELYRSALVSERDLTAALAGQACVRHADAESLLRILDPAVAGTVPGSFLLHNRVLPVARRDGRIIVATTEVDARTSELAKAFAPLPLETCLVGAGDFQRLWRALRLLRDSPGPTGGAGLHPHPEPAPEPETAEMTPAASRHVALFENLVLDAIARRSSDIHLERFEGRVRVRQRIDGDLYDIEDVPLSVTDLVGLLNVIKIRAELDISERRLPQGGRITMVGPQGPVDLRVQTQPTLHGEHAVLRILPRDRRMLALDDLGFPAAVTTLYRRLLDSPAGLVLVVGPTGSGKSTTLYAALQQLARDTSRKVITVEDPIEYSLDGVQQSQVHSAIGFTFDAAVRAFLREDPDVILVGEIRDPVTALEAIRASQTGHIVLSTLHCNDATDAVQRLRDLGIHPHSIAAELLAVLAQHLARRLCPACRREARPDPAILAEVHPGGAPADFRCFESTGCPRCDGRGTRGRVAVVEFLQLDQELRDRIALRPASGELRRAALGRGLHTMRRSALELVHEGVISLTELRAVLPLDRMGPEKDDATVSPAVPAPG